VLVTISDKKLAVDANSDGVIDYYNADVVTASDYYPFGMALVGRKYAVGAGQYRYGFNGKEKLDEIGGDGNHYDYGARVNDTRLGRWFSTDPITKAFINPYNFSSNNPTNFIDPDGGDEIHFFFYIDRTLPKPLQRLEKFAVIIRNNQPNTFIHHQSSSYLDDNGNKHFYDKPTEFYPTNYGSSSGLTGSKVFGVINIRDDDYLTLMKYTDDFPELQKEAEYKEFHANGTSGSKQLGNAQFWGSVIANNNARKERDAEEQAKFDFAVAAIEILAFDLFGPALLEEALAYRALKAEEELVNGAHFLSRHGAGTTMESQFTRATTGLTPDLVQKGAVNSSKFLSNKIQLEVLEKAKLAYKGSAAYKGSETK
jgi:RHS repeat-associated protein